MVIICTVLAMAAPSLRGFFASRQTADAAARITVLTQYARARAIAEGRVYRVNFDFEDRTYWLTAQEGGAFSRLMTEFGREFALPDGTTIEWLGRESDDGVNYLSFHPDGRTQAARLRLTGRQGDTFDVVCLSPTERFEVVVPEEDVY